MLDGCAPAAVVVPGKAWSSPQVTAARLKPGEQRSLLTRSPPLLISLARPSGPFLALQQHLVDSLEVTAQKSQIQSILQSLRVCQR